MGVRLLIPDDHAMMREGLKALLSGGRGDFTVTDFEASNR